MTLCTWHDRYAFVACAKFGMASYIGATRILIFHRIWIAIEKSFVNRVPEHAFRIK